MPKWDVNKVANSFIEIALQHGCSPENYCIFSKQLFVRTPYLLHIFQTPFPKTTSGWLLLNDSLMKSFFWSAAHEEIWLKSFKYIWIHFGSFLAVGLHLSLYETPQFHLISWCGNFVETHALHRVLGDLPETLSKLQAFYAVFTQDQTPAYLFWELFS